MKINTQTSKLSTVSDDSSLVSVKVTEKTNASIHKLSLLKPAGFKSGFSGFSVTLTTELSCETVGRFEVSTRELMKTKTLSARL